MSSNIIKKGTADEVRCAVTELRLSETFMDVPQLSVKVVSPTPITFEIGDYITYDYNGVTYTLRSIPEAAKNARPSTYGEAFVYNLVFYSPMWDLRNAPFLDLVLYDNGQHFTSMPDVTTYEDVYGIAARVQANMDNMYPGKWDIRVVSGLSADSTLAKRLSETQDFSLSDGKCLDALSQVYSQWGVSFVYSYESGKHVITIGGAETQEDTTGLFMYGRGNGLKVIKSSVQNASEIATRYYVYGGTQNMKPRYYNGRTMEPEYIHASDASNSTITGICSGRRLLGDNMYVPNLMIPVPKWGKSVWYVWTASSHSQAVFTEVRNPSIGDDYAFSEPNIGASRNVISSAASDSIVVNGFTYQYLTEVLYPDIRKAYIDAPQSYLDKYGIRPATLRFDGSGEREDIHPSIKGLTVGDIRAGLGSGAEYYPSTSVYTDPDERVDRVLSCDNPQDDGLTSSGANKYETVLTASVEQAVRNIDMTLEEREEDDPQEGSVIYKYYRADNAVILGNAFSVTVPSKSNLDFIFPLRLSVGMQTTWSVNARVSIYKTDASGVRSEVYSYEKTLNGNGDSKEFNLAPSVNERYAVNAGDVLFLDVVFTRITADYSGSVQPQFNVVIPAYTQQWRLAVSLNAEFYIKLKQIGFDISEVPTNDGENPVISMTSGQCGGYEFEIHDVSYNASDDSWTLRCARVQDGTLGQWFPNSIFGIEPDDTFVLLNIALPEVYITASEQRLYDAALAERLYEERPLLEPEIDSKVMAESPQVLRAGMWFSVKDTDLGLAGTDGGSYLILIDSVEVTDKPDTIRSFKVTLRNNKEDNVFVRMQRQIAQTSASVQSGQRSQTKTSVSEVPTKGGGGGEYIDTSDFVTLSTEQTVTAEKTFAGDVVLGGQRQDGSYGRAFVPSHAGPGVFDLYISSEPIAGEIPSGSGGIDETELWSILGTSGTQQIDASHMSSALAGYATQQWVQQQGYLTSSALTPYATKEWVEQQGYLKSVSMSSVGIHASWQAALAGQMPDYATSEELSSALGDYYTSDEVDDELAKYVTLSTVQTITGAKTFETLLTASGGISGSDADFRGYVSAGRLYVPSYNGNKVFDLYIGNAPIAGEAPSGSSGIDEAELWSILTDGGSGERIVRAHLPLDAVYEEDLSGFLTSVSLATISDLHASWDALLKAAKPTTLAGYGITNAYTQSEVDTKLTAYLPLAGGTMNDGAEIKFSFYGGARVLRIHEGLNWDMSNTPGGYANSYAQHIDPAGASYTGMGVCGDVNGLMYFFLGGSYASPWMVLTPSGNVGIGTTAPAYTLDVAGSIRATSYVYASQLFFENGSARLVFDSSSGATWIQGVSGKPMRLSGMSATDLPDLYMMAGKTRVSGDFVVGGRLYVPSYSGNQVYDLYISNAPVSGEAPSGSSGIDEAELWSILTDGGSGERIAKAHLPLDVVYEEDLSGFLTSVSLATISDLNSGWDSLLKAAPSAYVTRWPTAAEVGALTQSAADGRYAIQANDNNLISHSNEFNVIPAGFSNVVWFNFRAKGGTGSISQYIFGRGSAAGGEYAELLGSNFIADGGAGFIKRMYTDTSNFEAGPMWDNAAGTSHLAAIGYWNTPQKVFINPCYNEVTDAWDDAVGKHNFVVGKNFLTYNTYPILHSGNIGSYALTPSNYTSYLDSRYMNASGDTMTGPLTITTPNDDILIFNDPDGEKYFRIKAKANGTDWGGLVLDGRSSGLNLYLGTTTAGYKVWHAGNDGSGSGLDADLLDGTHKSGLLTALTSNATTNLSLTVGGTVKTVAGLYASFLEGKTLAETRRGMSFLASTFSAAGWYRVFTSLSGNASYPSEVILHIGRSYNSPQNEHYSFSICVGYDGDISITQLSGVTGGHLITKIRVVWDNSQVFHIDIYSAASSYSNPYGVTGQGYGTFTAFTPNAAIPDGYTAYEFTTVDGCKSDRGFSGALSGNATSATKLQTSRTLWGRPFDGMENVSGNMTGVGSISMNGGISGATSITASELVKAGGGVQVGNMADYGWYIGTGTRISAGISTARGVNVGSLLVSNLWADYTKVPTNGIYSKGNILSAGNIIAYSSSSRLVKDILPKRTTFSQRLTALGSVVDYRYNNVLKRDKDTHIGLVYENVRDAMPGMCYTHEGYGALNYLDTDYINLVAGAVQEHTDEIAHLKNKVASLEAEVTRLRRGLAA